MAPDHYLKNYQPQEYQETTVGQYYGTGGLSYTPRQELSGYQVFIQADP